MKVLVIEYHDYHDEILPSFVRGLRVLGHSADVMVSRECEARGIFTLLDESESADRRILDVRWKALLKAGFAGMLSAGYDAMILNSAEPEGLLRKFFRTRRRFIATVHNGELLQKNETYAHAVRTMRILPLVLAAFISRRCFGNDRRAFYPYYFGHVMQNKCPNRLSIFFVFREVSNSRRRNYISLLNALVEAKRDGVNNFRVEMIGEIRGTDYELFYEYATEAGVAHYLIQKGGGHQYSEYLSSICSADFILPLLDKGSSAYMPYFRFKQTSSIAISIGLGIIPVLDPGLADLYGLGSCAIRCGQGLYNGLRQAMELTTADRIKLRKNLTNIREHFLTISVSNLKTALEEL